jgi:hypothetical protein
VSGGGKVALGASSILAEGVARSAIAQAIAPGTAGDCSFVIAST